MPYIVVMKNTGVRECGPYEDLTDAKRERDRLNREVVSGHRDDGSPILDGETMSRPGGGGVPELQTYEIKEF